MKKKKIYKLPLICSLKFPLFSDMEGWYFCMALNLLTCSLQWPQITFQNRWCQILFSSFSACACEGLCVLITTYFVLGSGRAPQCSDVAVLAELLYYPLSSDETQNFGLGLCVK